MIWKCFIVAEEFLSLRAYWMLSWIIWNRGKTLYLPTSYHCFEKNASLSMKNELQKNHFCSLWLQLPSVRIMSVNISRLVKQVDGLARSEMFFFLMQRGAFSSSPSRCSHCDPRPRDAGPVHWLSIQKSVPDSLCTYCTYCGLESDRL